MAGRAFRLSFLLLIALTGTIASSSFAAGDDLDTFKEQLERDCAEKRAQVDQALAKAKQEGREVSPQVQQQASVVKSLLTATESLIRNTHPETAVAKEELIRNIYAAVGSANMELRNIERSLGNEGSTPIERAAAQIAEMKNNGTCGRGAPCASTFFDGAMPTSGVDERIPTRNTPFFGTRGSGYQRTTEEKAREITHLYGGWQGGVVLSGRLIPPETIDKLVSLKYDRNFNAFLLNGRVVYFLRIPPWSFGALCRAMSQNKERAAVSLGTIHTVVEEVLEGSDVAFDLKLADRFLGDLVFAPKNGVLTGYELANGYRLQTFSGEFNGAVLFDFSGFNFEVVGDILRLADARLDVRLVPLSDRLLPNGGLLPDYAAIRAGRGVPAAYEQNARHLTDNMEYYRKEPLIERVFAYGEAAAFLRGLKSNGFRLDEVARLILEGMKGADSGSLSPSLIPRAENLPERTPGPHVIFDPSRRPWPTPGYAFVHIKDRKLVDYAVEWVPNLAYMEFGRVTREHIYASKEKDYWHHDPGYTWAHPGSGQYDVRWVEGESYVVVGELVLPFIVSGSVEGTWKVRDTHSEYYVWRRPGPDGPRSSDYDVVPRSAVDCYRSGNKSDPACRRALKALNTVVTQNNDNAYAYYDRGDLYAFLGSYACAASDFKRALGLDSSDSFRKFSTSVRQYMETVQSIAEMDRRWIAYLKRVQAEKAGANWTSNALDLQEKQQPEELSLIDTSLDCDSFWMKIMFKAIPAAAADSVSKPITKEGRTHSDVGPAVLVFGGLLALAVTLVWRIVRSKRGSKKTID